MVMSVEADTDECERVMAECERARGYARGVDVDEWRRITVAQLSSEPVAAKAQRGGERRWGHYCRQIGRGEVDVSALWVGLTPAEAKGMGGRFFYPLYRAEGVAGATIRLMNTAWSEAHDTERGAYHDPKLVRAYDALRQSHVVGSEVLAMTMAGAARGDKLVTTARGIIAVGELAAEFGRDNWALVRSFCTSVRLESGEALEAAYGRVGDVVRALGEIS